MNSNHLSKLQFFLDLDDEEQLYDSMADQFNEMTGNFYAQANRLLLDRIHLSEKSRVLDLACGTGHIAIEIAKRIPQGRVVGVDRSERMLIRAREDAERAQVKNCEWWNRDIHHLQISPGEFDAAISCFALSYLGSEFLLTTLYQLLGKNGQVGITTSSVSSLLNWQPSFFKLLIEFSDEASGFQIHTLPAMPLNSDDLRERMQAAGFTNVKVESLCVPLEFPDSESAAYFLISAGWISNFFYRIREKRLRKKFWDRVLQEFDTLRSEQQKLSTYIEFLIAWTDPA